MPRPGKWEGLLYDFGLKVSKRLLNKDCVGCDIHKLSDDPTKETNKEGPSFKNDECWDCWNDMRVEQGQSRIK